MVQLRFTCKSVPFMAFIVLFCQRKCSPVVWALALRSGDPGDPGVAPGSPWFNFLAALVK